MNQTLYERIPSKQLFDVLGATPWRRIFENPKRLANWITFQLAVAAGHHSREQAMLSQHLAVSLVHVLKHHGPLYLAKYLKAAKLYKALAKDPAVSYSPACPRFTGQIWSSAFFRSIER